MAATGSERRRRNRAWVWASAALGVLAGTVVLAGAPQGTVLVLRSSDLAPYLAVQKGFTAELGNAKVVGVKDTSRDELNGMIEQAALVFAIGPEAEAAAEAAKHAHLLHALVTARAGQGVPIYASPERQAKAIRALLPDAKKLGVVYDPGQSSAAVDAYEAAARSAGFRLVRKQVHSRQEVAGALRSIAGSVDGIWLVPDVTVISADTFKFLIELSIENKLPVIGFSAGMAKAGALLAVEATYPEMGRRAAQAARRIISGGESPPQPADGAIYVNSATADMLGLSIPSEVRDQAAEVFE